MAAPTSPLIERTYTLTELHAAGLGSRPTLTKMIQSGELPAIKVRGAYRVRERDVTRLASVVSGDAPAPDPATVLNQVIETIGSLLTVEQRRAAAQSLMQLPLTPAYAA